jgi:serine protease Do
MATHEGSPAQKAGLRPEDTIIAWNGKEVVNPKQFIRLVQDTTIGSNVTIKILRRGKPLTVSALIEARKPDEAAARLQSGLPQLIPFTAVDPFEDIMGATTVRLTANLAEALRIPAQPGLLVVKVLSGMPFKLGGVVEGDVIISVNGLPVRDTDDILNHLPSGTRDGTLVLKLLRSGTEREVTVRLGSPRPRR